MLPDTLKKKLVLINPVEDSFKGKTDFYEPVALGIIAALTPPEWEIETIDENVTPFSFLKADLVAISSYTSNINRAYHIAAQYREKNIPVVIGGVHATILPDEVRNFTEVVACGAAEGIWPELIADFEKGNLKPIYSCPADKPLNFVAPRRDVFKLQYQTGTVQTSRGCPFDCDFCSVPITFNHKYFSRPVAEVLEEISSIPQSTIFFTDDNIFGYGTNDKKRFIELCQGLITNNLRKNWIAFASLNIVQDTEILKYARKSGCTLLMIGFESQTSQSLSSVNKKLNSTYNADGYRNVISRIHQNGIAVIGGFICGFENDSPDVLSQRIDFIKKNRIDIPTLLPLTPLPGTKLFARLSKANKLLYTNFPSDWIKYNLNVITFIPENISVDELKNEIRRFRSTFRNCRKLYWAFIKVLFRTHSFKTARVAIFFITNNYALNLKKCLLNRIISIHKR